MQIKLINRESIIYLVQELEAFEKDKALRSGLLSAGNLLMSGGKRRLKQRMKNPAGVTGNLLRSFAVRVKKNKPGVLTGFKGGERGGGYASWIDRGTKDRHVKKTNKYAGAVKGSKYWEDTRYLDSNKALERLHKGVERAVKRIQERRK